MHFHVIPGPQRTVTISHAGHCVVAVVLRAGRVVRLAHSLRHARDHVALVGGGLRADAECWDNLGDEERRAPCVCQPPGAGGPCAKVFSSGPPGAA